MAGFLPCTFGRCHYRPLPVVQHHTTLAPGRWVTFFFPLSLLSLSPEAGLGRCLPWLFLSPCLVPNFPGRPPPPKQPSFSVPKLSIKYWTVRNIESCPPRVPSSHLPSNPACGVQVWAPAPRVADTLNSTCTHLPVLVTFWPLWTFSSWNQSPCLKFILWTHSHMWPALVDTHAYRLQPPAHLAGPRACWPSPYCHCSSLALPASLETTPVVPSTLPRPEENRLWSLLSVSMGLSSENWGAHVSGQHGTSPSLLPWWINTVWMLPTIHTVEALCTGPNQTLPWLCPFPTLLLGPGVRFYQSVVHGLGPQGTRGGLVYSLGENQWGGLPGALGTPAVS